MLVLYDKDFVCFEQTVYILEDLLQRCLSNYNVVAQHAQRNIDQDEVYVPSQQRHTTSSLNCCQCEKWFAGQHNCFNFLGN
jgi:hypothetical protein